MNIALDATPLTVQKSGIGEYTYQLARHLALRHPQDDFLLLSNFPFLSVTGIPNLRSEHCNTNWISRRWWVVGLPHILERKGVSVFHGTDYSVPLLPLRPTVLTIHDLSTLRWSHLHDHRTRRTARRLPWMVRMATHIVTHSVTVREEIVQEFNLPKERVSVIPLAPGPQFFPASDQDQSVLEKYDVHQPYVLFVGTLEPRKNLVTLVRAFASLPPAVLSATHLVLCGRWGWMNDDLKAEIARFRPAQSLRITGYVPDSHLPALYRSATVFVYPSLYEGFGLPPVEAMASRVPVVASTAAALTEVWVMPRCVSILSMSRGGARVSRTCWAARTFVKPTPTAGCCTSRSSRGTPLPTTPIGYTRKSCPRVAREVGNASAGRC